MARGRLASAEALADGVADAEATGSVAGATDGGGSGAFEVARQATRGARTTNEPKATRADTWEMIGALMSMGPSAGGRNVTSKTGHVLVALRLACLAVGCHSEERECRHPFVP